MSTVNLPENPESETPLHMYEQFLGSKFLSDVSLLTTDDVTVPAHRVFLAAHSDVFRTMFSEHYTESTMTKIPVPFAAPVFQIVLRHIYTNRLDPIDLASIGAEELLHVVTFYQMDALKDHVELLLVQGISEDNLLEMMHLATRFSCPSLKDHCVTLMRQCNCDVMATAKWPKVSADVALLLIEKTIICGELQLLQQSLAWCHENSKENKEEVPKRIKNFLKFVDFTAMTAAELEVVEGIGCITYEDLYRIFKAHCLGLPKLCTPRFGGISLMLEKIDGMSVVNNHVSMNAQTGRVGNQEVVTGQHVYANNRFEKGKHYFTFSIRDAKAEKDCRVGVSCGRVPGSGGFNQQGSGGFNQQGRAPSEYCFEPCCGTFIAPLGTKIVTVKNELAPTDTQGITTQLNTRTCIGSLQVDLYCVVGVEVDFKANCIRWFNHLTQELLCTMSPQQQDGTGQPPVLLHTPLSPFIGMFSTATKVMLSKCTTYLGSTSYIGAPQNQQHTMTSFNNVPRATVYS